MEKQYILSVLVRNHEGVLVRIAGLLSRRFFNIVSIVAAQTENPAITQIIIVVQGNERVHTCRSLCTCPRRGRACP